jgi:Tol biopolymer transport system component
MKIVFVSEGGGKTYEICVMNVDRSGVTNLTNNPDADWSPDWSPR